MNLRKVRLPKKSFPNFLKTAIISLLKSRDVNTIEIRVHARDFIHLRKNGIFDARYSKKLNTFNIQQSYMSNTPASTDDDKSKLSCFF